MIYRVRINPEDQTRETACLVFVMDLMKSIVSSIGSVILLTVMTETIIIWDEDIAKQVASL